jgi:hypothetical protein
MSISATWTLLPEFLQEGLMAGAISLVEASQWWDVMLMSQADEWTELPPNLHPAAQRMYLLEAKTWPTRH